MKSTHSPFGAVISQAAVIFSFDVRQFVEGGHNL
jgi:hypothetical protein